MALSPRLELRQGQSLVMTPQLQQAIRLLQLSAAELAAFVEQELERNPLLERPEAEDVHEADAEPSDRLEPITLDGTDGLATRDGGLDVDPEALHPDMSAADHSEAGGAADWAKLGQGQAGGFEDAPDIEATLTREASLAEHLDAQMSAAGLTPAQRLIGAALIDGLDDWGYCRVSLDIVAETLGCPVGEVERVLTIMQGFEPVGVMARDLRECLALQLQDRNRLDPAMSALLDHLDLLARGDLPRLAAICGVDRHDLADMIGEIRALTPKPGAAFDGPPTQTAIPDVIVRASADGGWHVELNADTLPKVLMNNRYYAEVSRRASREQDKLFLSECASTANWLIKSLDQRANTILKVAREIVRQQDGFFAYGVQHLRPLNLKTVATAIEMHESTVSRVTSNKYMATPRGLFELKYFFTAAIDAVDGGQAHSAEAVRHRIKSLIERERPEEILSDDRIVEILREAGVDIARRTVAKYRESLRIPSSVERRRRLGRSI